MLGSYPETHQHNESQDIEHRIQYATGRINISLQGILYQFSRLATLELGAQGETEQKYYLCIGETRNKSFFHIEKQWIMKQLDVANNRIPITASLVYLDENGKCCTEFTYKELFILNKLIKPECKAVENPPRIRRKDNPRYHTHTGIGGIHTTQALDEDMHVKFAKDVLDEREARYQLSERKKKYRIIRPLPQLPTEVTKLQPGSTSSLDYRRRVTPMGVTKLQPRSASSLDYRRRVTPMQATKLQPESTMSLDYRSRETPNKSN